MNNRAWEENLYTLTPHNISAHEAALTALPKLVHNVFKEGGILETRFGKPYRAGQHSMAIAIAESLRDGTHIAAEAGTGTGKTLAYGVPAAILGVLHPGVPEPAGDKAASYSEDDDQQGPKIHPFQTVISVHTLALQGQLEGDLKLIADITEAATGQRPSYIRLSGRDNYFCEQTTKRLIEQDDENPEIVKIAKHLFEEYTTLLAEGKILSGLASELPSWSSVQGEFKKFFVASDSNCALHKGESLCNYDRAKAKAKKANLLVINHNLLAIGWPGTWHQKIIDEAHTLESVVVDITSQEASVQKLDRAMNRPNVIKSGPPGVTFHIPPSICTNILETCKDVENAIQENKIRRVRGPIAEPHCEKLEKLLEQIPKLTGNGIRSIIGAKQVKDEEIKKYFTTPGFLPDLTGIGRDYGKAIDALRNIKAFYNQAAGILEFAKGPKKEDSTIIHWTEESGPNASEEKLTLKITEADPRPALKNLHSGTPSILTSATLAGPKGLHSFIESHGLTKEQCHSGTYPAPFNIKEKMKVVIPAGLSEPGREEQQWKAELPNKILEAIAATRKLPGSGGTLILLTSRQDMNAVAKAIGENLASHKIPLLVQDGTRDRGEMIEHMKTHGNCVTLGLDSFWTGVDIPGNALRHVVITRVPFEVPTPLNEAKREIAEKRGQNAFSEVDLRKAVQTFRQGVGRLLRTTTDDGIITILDPRVLSKSYGKTLLENLPEPSRSYDKHEPAIPTTGKPWNGGYKRSQAPSKPAWNPTRPPTSPYED